MSEVYSLATGILMGLSIAAPPGPINAMMANESTRSFLNGIAVGAGAMTADFVFFWITYLFKSIIPSNILFVFYIVGGVYMLYLSYSVLRAKQVSSSTGGSYVKGLSVAIVNPYQISWWLTFGISMLNQFSVIVAPGFFIGILIWILAFPFLINRIEQRYVKYVKIFSFTILLIFGAYILYQGVHYFI
ncbi:lysine transporter LysE [Sulfolobus acidocaldarius SUSAZ]|nr:lysine transporter LysE [Sulfolobus acidocaldarius SUSAZ]